MQVFWVTGRLAFGSTLGSWRTVIQLHRMGITHVINLRSSKRYKHKLASFASIWLPFPDDREPRPSWFYRKALGLFEGAMQEENAKVYVFCYRGICRSASMAYFLLRASGQSTKRAERTIRRVRPCAILWEAYLETGEDFLRRRRKPRKK